MTVFMAEILRPAADSCVTLSDCADYNNYYNNNTAGSMISRQTALHRPDQAPASDVTDSAVRRLQHYDISPSHSQVGLLLFLFSV